VKDLRDLSDDDLVRQVPTSSVNNAMQFQAPYAMEMQRRLMVSLRAASDCADAQTARVIAMTDTLTRRPTVRERRLMIGFGIGPKRSPLRATPDHLPALS
jgi:hypothetical protein